MEYSTKPVVKRITEGSLKIFDSLKIEIGTGSFLRNMYTNQEKDEVVKADYSQTINYIYDASKNIDHTKEQIKTIIYYKNEKPYYATYNERKFNKESLTADDTYYFEFNTENIKENDSEKKIRKYVLYLSEDIISDK
ncbi:hypothetical protein [Kordia antarctica]|nr:hypothetical protein [Kordia antarctica]